MTREKLIKKYSKAVRRIGYSRFNTLPEKVKDLLKKETTLEKKVVLMERIADRYGCIPPFKVVRVDWEVDDEKDLDYLPKCVPVYKDINEEDIADYISDRYGFLIKGYTIESK